MDYKKASTTELVGALCEQERHPDLKLIRALLERGDEVRVLDNFSSGKEENLKDFQGEIDLIKGDLCEPTDLKKAIQKID